MEEQRNLREKGSQMLHKRVKLLIEIEHDPEFIARCVDEKVNHLDELDAEVAEINASYLTLKAVMDHYPKEADWVKRLSSLIAEIKESQKRKRGVDPDRISWKERCLAAEKECERLRADLNVAYARIAQLEDTLALMATGRKRELVDAA